MKQNKIVMEDELDFSYLPSKYLTQLNEENKLKSSNESNDDIDEDIFGIDSLSSLEDEVVENKDELKALDIEPSHKNSENLSINEDCFIICDEDDNTEEILIDDKLNEIQIDNNQIIDDVDMPSNADEEILVNSNEIFIEDENINSEQKLPIINQNQNGASLNMNSQEESSNNLMIESEDEFEMEQLPINDTIEDIEFSLDDDNLSILPEITNEKENCYDSESSLIVENETIQNPIIDNVNSPTPLLVEEDKSIIEDEVKVEIKEDNETDEVIDNSWNDISAPIFDFTSGKEEAINSEKDINQNEISIEINDNSKILENFPINKNQEIKKDNVTDDVMLDFLESNIGYDYLKIEKDIMKKHKEVVHNNSNNNETPVYNDNINNEICFPNTTPTITPPKSDALKCIHKENSEGLKIGESEITVMVNKENILSKIFKNFKKGR